MQQLADVPPRPYLIVLAPNCVPRSRRVAPLSTTHNHKITARSSSRHTEVAQGQLHGPRYLSYNFNYWVTSQCEIHVRNPDIDKYTTVDTATPAFPSGTGYAVDEECKSMMNLIYSLNQNSCFTATLDAGGNPESGVDSCLLGSRFLGSTPTRTVD